MEAMTTFSPAFLRTARSGTVSFFLSSGTEFGLAGARIEGLDLPADGVGVRRERRFVEVGLRPRLRVEMAVAVDAAHEHRRIAHLGLANVRGDITDRQSDAAIIAAVGARSVHQLDVV